MLRKMFQNGDDDVDNGQEEERESMLCVRLRFFPG